MGLNAYTNSAGCTFWDHHSEHYYFWRKKLQSSLKKALRILSPIAATSPELVTYPLGTLLTMPTNLEIVIEEYNFISFPAEVNTGISVGWNVIIDAPGAILTGVNLLLEEDDYRHTQNKIKGVLNIVSGVQGLALSYNQPLGLVLGMGAAGLVSPAFAFMTFCDLINASIDFYQASKEVDVETWFEERIQEINFLDKRIEELKKEESEHSANLSLVNASYARELTSEVTAKIKELEGKREKLKEDFDIRARVYCNEKQDCHTERMNALMNKCNLYNYHYQVQLQQSLTSNKKITAEDKVRDFQIQQELAADYQKKKIYLIMKAVSFTSATLYALSPLAGPAAPALIIPAMVMSALVVSYYIYMHRDVIKEAAEKLYHVLNHDSVPHSPTLKQ